MSIWKRFEKALRPLGGIIKGAVAATPGGQGLLMAREALISTKKLGQGVTPARAVLPGRGAANMGRALGTDSDMMRRYGGDGGLGPIRPSFAGQTMALTAANRTPVQLATRGQRQLPTLQRPNMSIRTGGGVAGMAAGTLITVGGWIYDKLTGERVGRAAGGRRRRKGISATELKAFTRVTSVLNKYCKTPSPTKRRSAPRGKACR
jgi:hypothetical protein